MHAQLEALSEVKSLRVEQWNVHMRADWTPDIADIMSFVIACRTVLFDAP